jgi:hypothetical protein
VKTVYKDYEIETDAEGKVASVTKGGKAVAKTFDDLPTAEAVMAKIDEMTKTKTPAKAPKPAKAPASAKGKTPEVKYSKDDEIDFTTKSADELRALFKVIEKTAIDLGLTNGVEPPTAEDTQEELARTCKNLHNFIKVRTMPQEAPTKGKKSKADRQRATAAGEDTMAKKAVKKTGAKKVAAKKTAAKKAPAKKAADGTWKGFALDAKIVKLQDNPLKAGTGKAKRWDAVLACKTVADVKAKKIPVGAVRNMIKAKVVKVG